MSFVLLDEVKGTKVSESDVWYRIQLDTPLDASRSNIDYSGEGYDFAKSYGYVHSSLLDKVIKGRRRILRRFQWRKQRIQRIRIVG